MTNMSKRIFLVGATAASAVGAQAILCNAPQARPRVEAFRKLWDSHPIKGPSSGKLLPCNVLAGPCHDGKGGLEHQCTIRMGDCIHAAFPKIRLEDLPEIVQEVREGRRPLPRTCKSITRSDCTPHDDNLLHIINARELQRAMDKMTDELRAKYPDFAGFAKGMWLGQPSGFRSYLKGKHGLIFFEDCYDGAGVHGGNHFDLWNGIKVKNEVWSDNIDSSFERSKAIRFWEFSS